MRITVVGASGNVGPALLRRLAADGEHDVLGVCRRIPPQRSPYDQASGYSVDVADVPAADQLTDIVAGSDAVVNLAWGFRPTRNPAQLRWPA